MSLLKRIGGATQPTQESVKPSASGGGAVPPPPPLETIRARQTPSQARDMMADLRNRIITKIIAELDPNVSAAQPAELRRSIEEMFARYLQEEGDVALARGDRQRLLDQVLAEITGYGPLEPLLEEATIDEVMVNGPFNVYVERRGKIEKTDIRFDSNEHVQRIIDRIVSPLGRRIDEAQPYVDARLPNGSRVNIIIPPLALNGPTITIRKFARTPFTTEDMIQRGTFGADYVEFITACVKSRLNIIITGGTGGIGGCELVHRSHVGGSGADAFAGPAVVDVKTENSTAGGPRGGRSEAHEEERLRA